MNQHFAIHRSFMFLCHTTCMHIILVEDNEVLAKSVVKVLKGAGFSTTHFIDGEKAMAWLLANKAVYDLVILDILLPGKNGYEICEAMRKEQLSTPILMLTSKSETDDIVHGLEVGADDYLKKPFEFEELLARIHALLRRPQEKMREQIQLTPDVIIDTTARKVHKQSKEVVLTTKEFAILLYFIHNPNKVINQQELYDHVFDYAEVQLSNTIEVHIKNLRKKLRTKQHDIPLTTIRAAGYRLDL